MHSRAATRRPRPIVLFFLAQRRVRMLRNGKLQEREQVENAAIIIQKHARILIARKNIETLRKRRTSINRNHIGCDKDNLSTSELNQGVVKKNLMKNLTKRRSNEVVSFLEKEKSELEKQNIFKILSSKHTSLFDRLNTFYLKVWAWILFRNENNRQVSE